MHEIGNMEVANGLCHIGRTTYEGDYIKNKYSKDALLMFKPAVIIDRCTGTVIKIGDTELSNIRQYYDTGIASFNRLRKDTGLDIPVDWFLLEFDDKTDVLDMHEICTLLNYMQNTIGEHEMERLLHLKEDELKLEIRKLAEIGF